MWGSHVWASMRIIGFIQHTATVCHVCISAVEADWEWQKCAGQTSEERQRDRRWTGDMLFKIRFGKIKGEYDSRSLVLAYNLSGAWGLRKWQADNIIYLYFLSF